MSYWFGETSSYGYGYNAQIGVMSPQPEYISGQSGMNYYPTQTIGVSPYAPVSNSPATGVNPMGYSYGYDGYISHPYVYTGGNYTSGTVPDYVSVTPSNFSYGANPVAPPIEYAQTTANNPYAPYTGGYVQVTPINPALDPSQVYAPYTGPGVTVTPNQLNNYYQPSQTPRSGGSPGGGSAGGSGGGNPSPPQRQQQQPQQRPVQVIVNTGAPNHRSGAGYAGGNTGALYNPYKQNGSYYGGSQYGNAQAGYNAPSIVPYLLLGGLGIAAFSMMKKHH